MSDCLACVFEKWKKSLLPSVLALIGQPEKRAESFDVVIS